MECASKEIEIRWIETGRLAPNPWNPNRMSGDRFAKLAREVKERGMLAPLLVRPLSGSRFQVVDGEHRLRIAKQLKLPAVPCVVSCLSDREARLKTLQMNGLRGENDPRRLADLLRELSAELDLEELSASLPWSPAEVEQMLSLAAADFRESGGSRGTPRALAPPSLELFTAVVDKRQKKIIDRALALAAREEKTGEPAGALTAVCRWFIGSRKARRAARGKVREGR